MRVAFSPVAIPCKVLEGVGEASTSKQSPAAVEVPRESIFAPKTNVPRPKSDAPRTRRRKRKSLEDKQESLEQFVARRKKAKKENKAKNTGFQHMITDYFKHTKVTIKTEKKEMSLPPPAKDVLQNVQYTFDKSKVPEDDDVEILEVIPGRNTASCMAEPFIYVVPDEDEVMKEEPQDEPMDSGLVTPKLELEPPITPKTELQPTNTSMKPVNKVTHPSVPSVGEVNPATVVDAHEVSKADAVSLEVESAREDNLDEGDKVSERETLLLQKVESLTKGLEDMKNEIRRERRASVTKSLASKLRQKMMKTKLSPRKPKIAIFEKKDRTPEHSTPEGKSKLFPPAEVQQSDVQWEEVGSSKVKVVSTEELVSEGTNVQNEPEQLQFMEEVIFSQKVPDVVTEVLLFEKEVNENNASQTEGTDKSGQESEGTQLTASEALNFLCGSEADTQKPITDGDEKDSIGKDTHEGKIDHSYAAGIGQDSGNGEDKDGTSKISDLNDLQKGVQNLDMGTDDRKTNDEDAKNVEEQDSDDEEGKGPTNPDDDSKHNDQNPSEK